MKPLIHTLMLLFCSFSLADDFQEQLNWFDKAQRNLSADIQNSDDSILNQLMNNLGSLWLRRDGALGSEVAPFITKIIVASPSIVFGWFKGHPKDFTSFVDDIQYSVFTDYNGDKKAVSDLEQLRTKAISACRSVATTENSTELAEMAKVLENHLKGISVRTVD